jgi:membrane-associated protease RseP (regulator of RpoE activity)
LRLDLIPFARPAAGPPARRVGSPALAFLLGAVSLFTMVTLGGVFYLGSRVEVVTDIVPLLLPSTIARVWGDPAVLLTGLQFALPTLFILLCHELGHYVVCRKLGLPATPPYFIPAPFMLGTLGAFIRIRGPIRTKKQLIEVGVGGPIAGFAALLPFLIYGVAVSKPVAIGPIVEAEGSGMSLNLPGQGLLLSGLARIFHGELPTDTILNPHPFLLAAWVGLFVTMLNLLPLGQLDGGHIFYAALGRRLTYISHPLWAAMAIGGFLWPGWWVWCVLLLALGLRHPPLVDETKPLTRFHRLLVGLAALLLLLTFMPVPLRLVGVAAP